MAGGVPPGPPPAPRDLTIAGIPGVVAGGGAWIKIWQQGGNSADGIVPDRDGNVLVAQHDSDKVLKLDPSGTATVAFDNVRGVGALTIDRQGRLYALNRTERAGSTKPDRATSFNAITVLSPVRRILTDKWMDGTPLSVRPNDIAPDSRGGVYFTVGCVYYADSKGVRVMAGDLRTNGIGLSPDEKTLYVTNGGVVVAFDVAGPGQLANRRNFGILDAGGGGDGVAVDTQGRLYVTSQPGVQVFDKTGQYLGLIPTPRPAVSVAFAGSGKRTLFLVGNGADDEDGRPIHQGPGSSAVTVYKLPMIAQGIVGRAK